jgi:hypothetical protein
VNFGSLRPPEFLLLEEVVQSLLCLFDFGNSVLGRDNTFEIVQSILELLYLKWYITKFSFPPIVQPVESMVEFVWTVPIRGAPS